MFDSHNTISNFPIELSDDIQFRCRDLGNTLRECFGQTSFPILQQATLVTILMQKVPSLPRDIANLIAEICISSDLTDHLSELSETFLTYVKYLAAQVPVEWSDNFAVKLDQIVQFRLAELVKSGSIYYEISCGANAAHVRKVTAFSDQTLKSEAEAIIERYGEPTRYHDNFIDALCTMLCCGKLPRCIWDPHDFLNRQHMNEFLLTEVKNINLIPMLELYLTSKLLTESVWQCHNQVWIHIKLASYAYYPSRSRCTLCGSRECIERKVYTKYRVPLEFLQHTDPEKLFGDRNSIKPQDCTYTHLCDDCYQTHIIYFRPTDHKWRLMEISYGSQQLRYPNYGTIQPLNGSSDPREDIKQIPVVDLVPEDFSSADPLTPLLDN